MRGAREPILEFDRVSFGYGAARRPALQDVSAAISPRSVTAVLGPNGAGKTTLLHLALGWLRPWGGRVLFEGRELRSYSRKELGRAIAIVPQSERIPFEYTVLEYVLLGRAPHLPPLGFPGEPDMLAAERALEATGIGALSRRDITALSGGERQLATIARALAQEARFLILDEPTSHLDLANKARLLELIESLSSKGITIVFSTHEPDIAEAVATDLMLMREGKLMGSGPIDEAMDSASLSAAYGIPVQVQKSGDRMTVAWAPAPRRERKGGA
jgi:iron complex transport system ATP-binding protein